MNAPRGIDPVDLDNRFAYHPATETTGPLHAEVREECRALAGFLASTIPPGRELSLAITAIEEAMMWANAGIARNQ